MHRKTIARRLAAVLGGCALGLILAPGALAAAAWATGPNRDVLPDVYGNGLLLAFSGLEGRTSWAEPCVASTVGDEVALRFHLPREAVLRVRVPAPGLRAVRWQLVSNDLLVGYVPWDDQALVIGFSSANMVVGRLPLTCRASLEGGDAGTVLLRNAIGDRTQFAFAYSPQGAKAAAAAAAQALKASIDTLVENRLDSFHKLPQAPIDADRLRAKTLAKAFSVLKANVYSPEPPITARWTTPARWPQRDMALWDSAFHSLGLEHLDTRLAQETLGAVYGFQQEGGMVPHRMNPGQPSDISQPCLLGWAAWQMYRRDKTPDRAFLERSFDVAQKHVTWLMKSRRLDGEPPPEKPLDYGTPLYGWKSAEESGAENSPRFEGGASFAAVDLSCYLANECWAIQAMAQALGYRELAKTWGQRAEAIAAAARKTLWHKERGFFFDRRGPDGEWVDVWSATGLLPLWAGVATSEQAAKLRDHLVSRKFWTATPVPSVARDDPKFKKDMWQGPTWVSLNYLLIRGLQRYGFNQEAADLRERTLRAVAEWYARTGALYEFYDCDGQSPPAELLRKGISGAAETAAGQGYPVVADYGPTAALYVDLLLRPKP
ncbi:MAG: hypothetical protein IMZ44_17190 [Planctomycetes bacterium]|nr:hypothetical protein [Planctomycetota bacterium]